MKKTITLLLLISSFLTQAQNYQFNAPFTNSASTADTIGNTRTITEPDGSITIEVLNDQNLVSERKVYSTTNELRYSYLYTYNTNGQVIKQEYDSPSSAGIEQVIHYTFNAQGKLTKEELDQGADGTIDATEIFTYRADGKRLTEEKRSSNNTLTYKETYNYNASDLLTSVDIDTDGDGFPDQRYENTYPLPGLIQQEYKSTLTQTYPDTRFISERDAQGNITEERVFNYNTQTGSQTNSYIIQKEYTGTNLTREINIGTYSASNMTAEDITYTTNGKISKELIYDFGYSSYDKDIDQYSYNPNNQIDTQTRYFTNGNRYRWVYFYNTNGDIDSAVHQFKNTIDGTERNSSREYYRYDANGHQTHYWNTWRQSVDTSTYDVNGNLTFEGTYTTNKLLAVNTPNFQTDFSTWTTRLTHTYNSANNKVYTYLAGTSPLQVSRYYTYTSAGDLDSLYFNTISGTAAYEYVRKYERDAVGHLIATTVTNLQTGDTVERWEVTTDINGNVTYETEDSDGDGIIDYEHWYMYDANKNLLEYKRGVGTTGVYSVHRNLTYDGSNNIIFRKNMYFDNLYNQHDFGSAREFVYQYNSVDSLVARTFYGRSYIDGTLIKNSTDSNEYNNDNLITKNNLIAYNENGSISEQRITTYVYAKLIGERACDNINYTASNDMYEVNIPKADEYVIKTCGSAFDTKIYVGDQPCFANLGSSDNDCGDDAELTMTLPVGKIYVVVTGPSTEMGDYTLVVEANNADTELPTSAVQSLPNETNSTDIELSWQGTDIGWGVREYDIYVSNDDIDYTLWQNFSYDQTSATYTNAESGKTYYFYSIAIDSANNKELAPSTADASTKVVIVNGVSAIANTRYSVYPNPSTEEFNISGLGSSSKLELIDPAGRVIHTEEVTTADYQVDVPTSGTYILLVTDLQTNNVTYIRIVKI